MKKRALLLAMNTYIRSKTINAPALPSTENDIRVLSKKLKQIEFDIISLANLSLAEMQTTVSKFAADAPCDSLNIIYFSGHGGHNNGTNYIYPIDFGISLDKGKKLSCCAYDIQNFSKEFKRDVKLIIIIDACRSDFATAYGTNYSEMFAPKNTYIAYATQFTQPSICNSKMSLFTEVLCENILIPNISVDELFIRVRAALYLKYSKQVANSMNAFMEYVTLHQEVKSDDIGASVLNFIDKFGDMYVEKYGVFAGDDLVFIDAAQYCGISVLDAIYKYMVLDRKRYKQTTSLTEAHEKLISFWGMLRTGLKQDDNYTWEYRGRPIRLGEIPPLPADLQKPLPDFGKEIDVSISITKHNKNLMLNTNLPNNMVLFGKINGTISIKDITINNGEAIIEIPDTVKTLVSLELQSVAINVTGVNKEIVGDRCRNLVGKHIVFDPISGNMVKFFANL